MKHKTRINSRYLIVRGTSIDSTTICNADELPSSAVSMDVFLLVEEDEPPFFVVFVFFVVGCSSVFLRRFDGWKDDGADFLVECFFVAAVEEPDGNAWTIPSPSVYPR